MKYKFSKNEVVKLNETMDFRKTGGPVYAGGLIGKVIRRRRDGYLWVDFGKSGGRAPLPSSAFSPVYFKVKSRNGKETGLTTGSWRSCQMDGCRGQRFGVRWKDGKLTFPCTHGMFFDDNTQTWKIQ